MKNKFHAFKQRQNAYYFDHRNGVLKKKKSSPLRVASSLMSVVIVAGGFGFGINQAIHLFEKPTQTSFQREADPVQPSAKPQKIKDVITQPREDEQLAKQVKSRLKDVPGGQKWSLYIRDLKSDRMVSIDADKSYESGALSNLFLPAVVESKLTSDKWNYRAGGSTVEKCIVTMISERNDTCARIVSQYTDMKNADSVLNGLGIKKTSLQDKTPKTTAREVGDLLHRLQNGQIMSDKAQRAIFDGLYNQKSRDGIASVCAQPTGKCLVADIPAEGKAYRHDAAIVTTDNSQYVVVMMSEGASFSQMADVTATLQKLLVP